MNKLARALRSTGKIDQSSAAAAESAAELSDATMDSANEAAADLSDAAMREADNAATSLTKQIPTRP